MPRAARVEVTKAPQGGYSGVINSQNRKHATNGAARRRL